MCPAAEPRDTSIRASSVKTVSLVALAEHGVVVAAACPR